MVLPMQPTTGWMVVNTSRHIASVSSGTTIAPTVACWIAALRAAFSASVSFFMPKAADTPSNDRQSRSAIGSSACSCASSFCSAAARSASRSRLAFLPRE